MPKFSKQQLMAQALRAQGLTPEQVASEQMGDIEFQQELAARRGPVGYAMELDPAVANFTAYEDGPEGYTTNALYALPDGPGKRIGVPTEKGRDWPRDDVLTPPGEIRAFGVKGANPKTWVHEYSHKEHGTSEGKQREIDAFSARNEDEWDQAMDAYAGYRGEGWDREKADAHMRSVFKGKDRRFDRLDRHAGAEFDKGGRLSQQDKQGLFSKGMDKVFNDPESMRARKDKREYARYADERIPQTYIGRALRGS